MDPAVYMGVDIGKTGHVAVAVDSSGAQIHQTAVANDEPSLRELVGWARDRQASMVVDQPGGTAALLLKLCWQAGVRIGYLHGLAMARARDFYAGESKTDPKDAFVLADVARAHPTRVVWLEASSESMSRLELLCGYDADLAADATRVTNRLRALLATYWPSLERALDKRLARPGVLAVLQQYPGGAALQEAGLERVTAALKTHRVGSAEPFARQVYQAALRQTVAISGSHTATVLVRELAAQLAAVVARRAQLDEEIAESFFLLPEAAILRSLPGIGPRLGARIALEIGSITRFRTPGHLAAYAGLGPTPWRSGTSINANKPTRFGNHRLKNALFQAAFASLRHPPSRAYYDRKRAEGRRHNEALLCLARRRIDVLYAMLSQGTLYRPPAPLTAAA